MHELEYVDSCDDRFAGSAPALSTQSRESPSDRDLLYFKIRDSLGAFTLYNTFFGLRFWDSDTARSSHSPPQTSSMLQFGSNGDDSSQSMLGHL